MGDQPNSSRAVVIAGGGPTGMMLAAELKLAGVDVAIVERRVSAELQGSRAGGLHARTLEVLDQRGIVDRFLAEGQVVQVNSFAGVRLDLSDFPSRHPYGLGLWQNHIERILLGWIGELGVLICRGREVTGFIEDATGIDVQLSDGRILRTQYLVGCDGGRSTIRKAAGIGFPGSEPTISNLIGEVEMTELPELGIHQGPDGIHSFGRREYEIRDGKVIFKDEGPMRVMFTEPHAGATADPTLEDIRQSLIRLYGRDFGVHSPTWISRFTDAARQAEAYRKGRVLLAGDAAHIHYPVGGQGLNLGVQDAVNLGWKLAQVVKGISPESLLDTYHAERHPVGARVLRTTLAQVALVRPDDRSKAARDVVAGFMAMAEPRKAMAGELSGLDIHYDLGAAHPLVGRRMPDLDLVTADGPRRVYTYLHDARPLLLNLGGPSLDMSGWTDRVRFVDAEYKDILELPVLGQVEVPEAILIRPDGHVAWAGNTASPELSAALTTWFGPSNT